MFATLAEMNDVRLLGLGTAILVGGEIELTNERAQTTL